jgi:iron complex outermembrane receptor protein
LNNGSTNILESHISGNINGDRVLLSDYYIQNGSFLRMDNINIGYTIGKVFNHTGDLSIGFNVQNAFTITKYKGVDPEISSGIDNNFYPRPRTFVLGLNLAF